MIMLLWQNGTEQRWRHCWLLCMSNTAALAATRSQTITCGKWLRGNSARTEVHSSHGKRCIRSGKILKIGDLNHVNAYQFTSLMHCTAFKYFTSTCVSYLSNTWGHVGLLLLWSLLNAENDASSVRVGCAAGLAVENNLDVTKFYYVTIEMTRKLTRTSVVWVIQITRNFWHWCRHTSHTGHQVKKRNITRWMTCSNVTIFGNW